MKYNTSYMDVALKVIREEKGYVGYNFMGYYFAPVSIDHFKRIRDKNQQNGQQSSIGQKGQSNASNIPR